MFCAHIPKLDSSASCFIQSRTLAALREYEISAKAFLHRLGSSFEREHRSLYETETLAVPFERSSHRERNSWDQTIPQPYLPWYLSMASIGLSRIYRLYAYS